MRMIDIEVQEIFERKKLEEGKMIGLNFTIGFQGVLVGVVAAACYSAPNSITIGSLAICICAFLQGLVLILKSK